MTDAKKPDPKKPDPKKKKSAADAMAKPWHEGDPLPVPDVVEKNSDTSWAMFEALQQGKASDFEATRRSGPVPLAGRGHRATSGGGAALDEAMAETRRNNRVCPQQAFWLRLCQLLQKETGKPPPPPIGPNAWATTPSLTKRVAMRILVEWAGENNALPPMLAYLRMLPEDKWVHMGD
jgi:hypothetical protein